MAGQRLIYERAVPVTKERYKDFSVQSGDDYGFASRLNAVPLARQEDIAGIEGTLTILDVAVTADGVLVVKGGNIITEDNIVFVNARETYLPFGDSIELTASLTISGGGFFLGMDCHGVFSR